MTRRNKGLCVRGSNVFVSITCNARNLGNFRFGIFSRPLALVCCLLSAVCCLLSAVCCLLTRLHVTYVYLGLHACTLLHCSPRHAMSRHEGTPPAAAAHARVAQDLRITNGLTHRRLYVQSARLTLPCLALPTVASPNSHCETAPCASISLLGGSLVCCCG